MRPRDSVRQPVVLPPDIDDETVAIAADTYTAVEAQRRQVRERVAAMREQRPSVVAADEDAFAAAILAGRKDPGRQGVLDFDRKMLDAEREANALGIAVGKARDALSDAIADKRSPWLARIEADYEAAAERQRQAAREWTQAREERLALAAKLSFVAGWPTSMTYKLARLPVVGTRGLNGGPLGHDEVAAALVADAAPLAPYEPVWGPYSGTQAPTPEQIDEARAQLESEKRSALRASGA